MKTYTKNQQEVINLKGGYNMVLAGPGCGKTDILAERIAKACETDGIQLEDMLCLTFTNRAARGMFNRIQERLGGTTTDLFVGNIHRYCSHFLYENNVIPNDSAIVDEDDLDDILKTIVSTPYIYHLTGAKDSRDFTFFDFAYIKNLLGLDIPHSDSGYVKSTRKESILRQIRLRILDLEHLIYQIQHQHPEELWQKTEILDAPCFLATFENKEDFINACLTGDYTAITGDFRPDIISLFDRANRIRDYKTENDILDFEDILLITYDAYTADTDRQYKRYSWIQIDEVQDLSNFQIALVDLLTDTTSDFTVLYLGDEQQAIFSFMGGSLQNLYTLRDRCANQITLRNEPSRANETDPAAEPAADAADETDAADPAANEAPAADAAPAAARRPEGHLYRLDKNFRSPKYLLDLYNDYAKNELGVQEDFLPQPKDNQEAGEHDLCIQLYDTKGDEEAAITKLIPYLMKHSDGNDRTAVLVTWNSDADMISRQLTTRQIDHFRISGKDAFQSRHIKTLLAHLTVISNPHNTIAWSRILRESNAVKTYADGRTYAEELRNHAMTPADLLRTDHSTYVANFVQTFRANDIVLYDTETTGIDVTRDEIVQIAAVKIHDGQLVPGSNCTWFLKTDREIPAMLGKIVNPMIEAHKAAEAAGQLLDRAEALGQFMEYCAGSTLLGHNINYDYNILRNNLRRDCPGRYDNFTAETLDTLMLARLLFPKLKRHKLGFLVDHFHLQGQNSHMADDDIMATWYLAEYLTTQADARLQEQENYLYRPDVQTLRTSLHESYKECYDTSRSHLYTVLSPVTAESRANDVDPSDTLFHDLTQDLALTREMQYASDYFKDNLGLQPDEKYPFILHYFAEDVISPDESNCLAIHLSNHLMDANTFKEADLCDSMSLDKKIFVSTVHKAKGLEFENVIVVKADNSHYPFANTLDAAGIEESKRVFYVAISRAKKRLLITSQDTPQDHLTDFIGTVNHHFCLRFALYSGERRTILADLTLDQLTLTTLVTGSPATRETFTDLRRYTCSPRFNGNLHAFKRSLKAHFSSADAVSRIRTSLTASRANETDSPCR